MNLIKRKKAKNSELRNYVKRYVRKFVFTFLQFEYNGKRLIVFITYEILKTIFILIEITKSKMF